MNNGTGDTSNIDQLDSNDEVDNLSDWQYLTATFDNDQMFNSDVESTRLSRLPLDRLHGDRTSPGISHTTPLKRSRSNSAIYDEIQHSHNMRSGLTNQFISAPESQNDHHCAHDATQLSRYATTTAFAQREEVQINSTELQIRAWSHPQFCGNMMPQFMSHWQHNTLVSNFTHHPIEASNIPSQSISLRERSEKCSFVSRQVVDNEANSLQMHLEPLGAAPLPYVPLSKTLPAQAIPVEYKQSRSSVRDFQGEDAELKQVKKAATSIDQFVAGKDAVSLADNQLKSTNSMQQQDILRTSEIVANFTGGADVDGGATSAVDASDKEIIDKRMRLWISLMGTLSATPPSHQSGNKKLLLHPLTAYNYYYRDERDNIVSHISDENDPLPPSVSDFTIARMQALLHQHWFVDPVKKKRKHRKSHGKMNFQRLSKVIAQRWHQLPQQGRDFYRMVSRYDDIYYHQQLDTFKQGSNV